MPVTQIGSVYEILPGM